MGGDEWKNDCGDTWSIVQDYNQRFSLVFVVLNLLVVPPED
jgi:hypothetical protein